MQFLDEEIGLMETMKKCIMIRVEGDKKYVEMLSNFLQAAQKMGTIQFETSIYKAWNCIVQETDKMMNCVRQNVEGLSSKVLKALGNLIAEKKIAKKVYREGRSRLEEETLKLQEEVHKYQNEYSKTIEKYKVDKARYEDVCAKGKLNKKLEDTKAHYLRTTARLHKLHNDYIIAIQVSSLHQGNYLTSLLPALLTCHRDTHTHLTEGWKDLLSQYVKLTCHTDPDSCSVTKTIIPAIDAIEAQDYFTDFIEKYKTEPLTMETLTFDKNLLEGYDGTLVAEKLAVDDLTANVIKQKLEDIRKDISKYEDQKKVHAEELDKAEEEIENCTKHSSESDLEDSTMQIQKLKCCSTISLWHLTRIKTTLLQNEEVAEFIDQSIQKIEGDPPPAVPNLEFDPSCLQAGSGAALLKKFNSMPNTLKKFASRSNLFNVSSIDSQVEDAMSISSPYPTARRRRRGNLFKSSSLSMGMLHVSSAFGSIDRNNYDEPGNRRLDLEYSGFGESASCQRLEDEEWFHGVLPREEVQRLLVNDGDYLVRESKNKKTNEVVYVLSVYWNGHKHFIIQTEEGGWRLEGPVFPTIQHLLSHQIMKGQPVTNKSQAILKNPILREPWELKNDDILLEMKIGNGNFGEVYKGKYQPKNMTVAVKTCKDSLTEEQRKTFLQEGRILKQYDHPNIVKFIGIAAQRKPVMIVMEFVAGGSLLLFLRKSGRQQTRQQLVLMCENAAAGMDFLEEKNCIHRDLAARNCLVGENNVIKISDFGMSREEEMYVVSDGMKQIPIKWTAPEALNYGKYTSLCDVWSFGVLMWEVFSAGTTPYQGMTNPQAKERIDSGYRMPAPPGTPEEIYQLMLRCWTYEPESRPHFNEIHKELKKILSTY